MQAFSIGKGGDVFLLDMGEPVKIIDLATNLILLSGFKPGKDIKIQFTGLRPGEKLFEELNLHNESLLPTMHAKIRRYASPSNLECTQLMMYLQELEQIVEERDEARLMELLEIMIPDYTPSAQLREAALPAAFSAPGEVGLGISGREERDLIHPSSPLFLKMAKHLPSPAEREPFNMHEVPILKPGKHRNSNHSS